MAIYRLLKKDISFDPESVQAMYLAYEEACEKLELSNEKNDRVTEFVALMIIEVAKTGERNPATMRDKALALLGVSKRD